MIRRITVVVLLTAAICAYTRKIPGYLSICQRDTPYISKCLLNATHAAKPYTGKGIKELGIPPLEPFKLDQVNFTQGFRAINYKVNLTNITVYGLTSYVFRDLNFDSNRLNLFGTVLFDSINVTANYDIKGFFLIAPIKAVGTVTVNIGPTRATFGLSSKLDQDKKHLVPSNITIEIGITSGKAHFVGVINDNEDLSRNANRILNDNAEELLQDTVPAVELISGQLVETAWKNLNKLITYDDLIPLPH